MTRHKPKPEPTLYCGPGRNRVHCRRCGEVVAPPLPMTASEIERYIKALTVVHEHCQPSDAESRNP